jgi:uncharacterized protein
MDPLSPEDEKQRPIQQGAPTQEIPEPDGVRALSPAAEPSASTIDDPLMADRPAEPLLIEAQASGDRMAPVAASSRLSAIDILRGAALFGILMANMRGFFSPGLLYFDANAWFKGQWNEIANYAELILFQGKFVTLFSILFGLGFAIQMDRAKTRGQSDRFYLRRLLILLLIGCVHAFLIWWGDILIPYALTGILLYLFFRHRSQKVVATFAIVLFAVALVRPTARYVETIVRPPVQNAASAPGQGTPGQNKSEHDKEIADAVRIYGSGSYMETTRLRMKEWQGFVSVWFLLQFVLPRFLFGMWIWRSGLFRDLKAHASVLKKVALACFALGVFCTLWGMLVQFGIKPKSFDLWRLTSVYALNFGAPALGICYGSALLFLLTKDGWMKRLSPLGAVGRMALTNYLMQSIVCQLFFRWTGLYGNIHMLWVFPATIVFFGLQIPLSVWWLHQYRFGPVEWLWRSLTYGSWQPMRRDEVTPIPATAEA